MSGGATGAVVRQIERLFRGGTVVGLSEGQLLERFVNRRDEAAFEALVVRHGPMVLGVCRRLLRDPNDVDDAFQATFLVLVRKAGSLRRRDLLGNWFYGVAYRVSVRSRALAARRAAAETTGVELVAAGPDPADPAPELHEEVHRLPERYRVVVVLCYLEGLTHEEAAARLGCPLGTVKGRLARARDLLRSRLTRRGLTPGTGLAVAGLLGRDARAAVPAALFEQTLKTAALASAPLTAAGLISAQALLLSDGVSYAMSIAKFKTAVFSVTLAGTVLTGVGVLAYQGKAGDGQARPDPGASAEAAPGAPTAAPPNRNPSPGNAPEAGRPAPATPAVAVDEKARRSVLLDATREEQKLVVQDRYKNVQKLQEEQAALNLRLEYARRDLQRAEAVLARVETQLLSSRIGVDIGPGVNPQNRDQPSPPPGAPSAEPAAVPPLPATPGPGGAEGGSALPGPRPVGGGGAGGFSTMPYPGPHVGMGAPALVNPARQMRVIIAGMADQVAHKDKSPATAAILKKLDTPIGMSFPNPTPLDDVLKYIKSASAGPEDAGIPIYVDPDALNAHIRKVGVGSNPLMLDETQRQKYLTVALDLEGVPLKTSLRLLLKQLDLAYCVKDGLLIISSVEGVLLELREAQTAQEAQEEQDGDGAPDKGAEPAGTKPNPQ